jgi:antibiotic biosynthesis monooxygenase (ABM) superfamily enzyme
VFFAGDCRAGAWLTAIATRFSLTQPLVSLSRKEVIMLAKILIRRRFKKHKTREILPLLNHLRSGAMQEPGYISGITLVSYADPEDSLVIGTWQNIGNWLSWKESQSRKALESMLEIYQEGPTVYEEYIVGTAIPE